MPLRVLSRDATWLLPPDLDELIGQNHAARYVATFVDDTLERRDWLAMGIALDGEPLGASAYDPRGLLAVWLYGFMTGVRSTRQLERACRENLAYLWLTGWQHPDHSTLWRFYQANRQGMRELFTKSVKTAVQAGLVDLAVQAVDGTKVAGNAARKHTLKAVEVRRLLERVEGAITELEAQNSGGDEPAPAQLPVVLANRQALREKLRQAKAAIEHADGPQETNLTDGDATIMKTQQGYVAGYNAQAMVAPVNPLVGGGSGFLITAADVGTNANDSAQLEPMVQQAQDTVGQPAALTLADGGYHSGANLAAMATRGQTLVMPAVHRGTTSLYDKDAFAYDAEHDQYTCPQGQVLRFGGTITRQHELPVRRYRAEPTICHACPVRKHCTTNRRHGRTLEVTQHEPHLHRHRAWMASETAKGAYRQRQQLVEPVFGILKECQQARRFLLRGLHNVQAEWSLLATTFNLRTLCRVWQRQAGNRALAGVLV